MHRIVQTKEQLDEVQRRINSEPCYVNAVPVNRYVHYAMNEISSINILFEDDTFYCVPVNHPDAHKQELDFSSAFKVIVFSKKTALHQLNVPAENVVDGFSLLYLNGESIPDLRSFYSSYINNMKTTFKFANINLAIPLVGWAEYSFRILSHLKCIFHTHHDAVVNESYRFTNDIIIPTLYEIEKSGLLVDRNRLKEHFNEKIEKYVNDEDKVFSEYNIYTTTGRPSNSYGGINFSALNKADGTRSAFTSRFGDDGVLIQLDYEAFHLRIVASEMSYDLPDSSIHEYLAKQYFGKDNISKEEYEQAKAKTFAFMYGDHNAVPDNIKFFSMVKNHCNDLWRFYEKNGYILSKSGRKIKLQDNPSKTKLFNYYMQMLETEVSISRLKEAVDFLKDKKSKIVLYTYDAVLIDVHNSEVKLISRLMEILSKGGYHLRRYVGKNYDNMTLQKR